MIHRDKDTSQSFPLLIIKYAKKNNYLCEGVDFIMGNFVNSIDLTGKKYNNLTVKNIVIVKNQTCWNVKCDCGNEFVILGHRLKNGSIKSCGCIRKKNTLLRNTTHNLTGTPSYYTWSGMIQRCTNVKSKHYKDYGGRGITVCDKWLKFEGFFEDMGERPNGLTLDRKDNDGNYCKENCRWSTKEEQSNNSRSTRQITYNGKTQTLTEWSKELGIKRNVLNFRLFRNWSIERAFTTK